MLGSFRNFRTRFDGGEEEEAAKAQNELASRIGPFILRRRKSEVALELPEKTEQTVYCEMDNGQRACYMRLLEEGRGLCNSMLKGGGRGRMNVLTVLLRLRQTCCHPSLLPEGMRPPEAESSKTELLKELLMENMDSGHKTLVFSQFTSLLAIIRGWLDSEGVPYEYLDGATKDRMDHVNRFNSDKAIPLFLLSLKAGGTGLNLTAADSVIIYDPWWNPAVEDQAADRVHRIGQTRNVFISRLVMKDSIEERVIQLHERKKTLFRNLVENASFFRKLSDDDIAFLLR
jgi:SNF2 family DNA or RNA helicase